MNSETNDTSETLWFQADNSSTGTHSSNTVTAQLIVVASVAAGAVLVIDSLDDCKLEFDDELPHQWDPNENKHRGPHVSRQWNQSEHEFSVDIERSRGPPSNSGQTSRLGGRPVPPRFFENWSDTERVRHSRSDNWSARRTREAEEFLTGWAAIAAKLHVDVS